MTYKNGDALQHCRESEDVSECKHELGRFAAHKGTLRQQHSNRKTTHGTKLIVKMFVRCSVDRQDQLAATKILALVSYYYIRR